MNVLKPVGMTSHDVVSRIRRLSGQKAVGHAGTLDPLATGVLVVLLGKATALSNYAMAGRKTYAAEVVLGVATTTDDAEGHICREAQLPDVGGDELRSVLQDFVGEIQQVPPRFSAIKQQGQRAYSRSRAGKDVDLSPRQVTIYSLAVQAWSPPRLRITLQTSSGTYVRSVARDLGERLHSAAYLHCLVRLQSGDFSIQDSVPLDALQANGILPYLQSPDTAVRSLPAAVLGAGDTRRARHGGVLQLNEPAGRPCVDAPTHRENAVIRLYGSEGEFIGLARPSREGGDNWHPFKVLEPLN